MKRFILPAVLASVVGLAWMPTQAHASWLSEAVHQIRGDYYPAYYYNPPVYDYVSPGYSAYYYTPSYVYPAPSYYSYDYYTPGPFYYGGYRWHGGYHDGHDGRAWHGGRHHR